MSFLEQWKSAKDKFETTAKQKKPTDKFWNVFRKGNSVEAALKEVDGAKTRKDITKAAQKFEEAASSYCEKLTSEANDPKSVPKVDKDVYIAATQKLEKSLQKIRREADGLAESLETTADKDKVDAKALQAAEQHIDRQRRAIEKIDEAAKTYAEMDAEMKKMAVAAAKYLKEYLDPKKTDLASVNAMNVQRFCDTGMEVLTAKARPMHKAFVIKKEVSAKLDTVAEVKSAKVPVPDRMFKECEKLIGEVDKASKAMEVKYDGIQKTHDQLRLLKLEAKPVDRESLEDAKAHLELRIKMISTCVEWAKAAVKDLGTMDNLLLQVRQYSAQAQTAQTYNNKTELNTIESEAKKLYKQAETLYKKVTTEDEQRKVGGGDLMRARGDSGTSYDALPPRIRDPLKKKRGEAFGKLDQAQRAWALQVNKLEASYVSLGSFIEQIETLNGKAKAPAEYIKRLQPLASEMESGRNTMSDRTQKAIGLINNIIPTHLKNARDGNAEAMHKALQKHYDLFTQAREKADRALQTSEIAVKRAEAVVSTDKEVTKLVNEVKKAAGELQKNYKTYDVEYKKADTAFQDAFKEMLSLV